MPACSSTPAEAKRSTSQTIGCPSNAASMTMDFDTKPEKSGNAEMDAAPTMQKPVVHGIDL